MGIRDVLMAPESRVKVGAAAGLLLVAVGSLLWSATGGESAPARSGTKLYYSVDDGATYFTDSAALVPPFQRDGKTAVEAFVFTPDGGKTRTVGYLQRFTADVKKRLDNKELVSRYAPDAAEVKEPGTTGAWVSRNSKHGVEIINGPIVKSGGHVEPVLP